MHALLIEMRSSGLHISPDEGAFQSTGIDNIRQPRLACLLHVRPCASCFERSCRGGDHAFS